MRHTSSVKSVNTWRHRKEGVMGNLVAVLITGAIGLMWAFIVHFIPYPLECAVFAIIVNIWIVGFTK
jgi:hypothetical protein